ncbi:MAG: DNA recombination/repair protein RecA, partial [bacterium]
ISPIKDGETVIGSRARVKVVKNKVSSPFRQVEVDIMHTEGISQVGSLLDLAAAEGIVQKSGTWFSYDNERIGQGRENAKRTLSDNPTLRHKIETKLRHHHGLDALPAAAAGKEKENKPIRLPVKNNEGA